MMAFVSATLLLLRTHFARVLFSRRMVLCLLIALGPSVLAALVLTAHESQSPPQIYQVIMFPGWLVLLQVVVPVVSLIMGSAVISEEIDDRTITYLFTRPLPRAALLLGRWIAAATILAILLGGSALLLAGTVIALAPSGSPDIPHAGITLPLVQMAMAGGAVYSALFATIGVFLRHPMIVGLAYAFVIEVVLANVPGKSQGLTVLYHLRSYVASASSVWEEISDEMLFELEPQSASLTWLLTAVLVALLLGSIIVSRKQYVLTA